MFTSKTCLLCFTALSHPMCVCCPPSLFRIPCACVVPPSLFLSPLCLSRFFGNQPIIESPRCPCPCNPSVSAYAQLLSAMSLFMHGSCLRSHPQMQTRLAVSYIKPDCLYPCRLIEYHATFIAASTELLCRVWHSRRCNFDV
jgi:hypothetical protein